MPVELKGSCHCGTIRFSLQSSSAVPYQLCLCSICRKVGGVGGSINLGGFYETLKIEKGKESISVYKAVLNRDTPEESIASSERNFCSKCSAMLWLYDKSWPELVHPFASAIDSPLKTPETLVCILNDSKPEHVRLPEGAKEHKKNGLWVE
ncbi:Mss4-like protein [Favolaschia claudopus]|uniref:Mss4-like protein n=1 Tax=Favolaschia claudopus TaxID=2862362 RepID=A0AAV9Z0Z8_9AGAR